MRMRQKKLPVGIENFEDIRKEPFYYADKTGLLVELLDSWGAVNLFTRPRRFGKTLNMSMLEHFFSLHGDKSIFDGLQISKETELCDRYMGKYPVVSVSLKGIEALSYEKALQMAVLILKRPAARVQYLLESTVLSEQDKADYRKLLDNAMGEAMLCDSLRLLCELLEKHHGRKVILLIDEYDVPLAKAFEHGYYEQMVSFIRSLLGQALKTNSSLKFAVLTGCLRISKESIFTGLNNLRVITATDTQFGGYFGFTDKEVRRMLEYYACLEQYDMVKKWYDGYQFGNTQVYCPWDVICHLAKLRIDKTKTVQPQNYWINTSSNSVVKQFIQKSADAAAKREIERLVAGETIRKKIYEELSYPEMYQKAEHLWSMLFMTGYLTKRGNADGRSMELAIPNLEIRDIFMEQIMEYFQENIRKDGDTLNRFCSALQNGDAQNAEKLLASYLRKTISIRDTSIRNSMKENFYHGVLIGILGVKEGWGLTSNREMGEGYADILAEPDTGDMGIIIEVKYAHDANLDAACREALSQIEHTRYEDDLLDDGIGHILKYGIACYKKQCRVMLAENMQIAQQPYD